MPRFLVRDFGSCLNFDGSGKRISFAGKSQYNFTNQFSISMWVKPNILYKSGTTQGELFKLDPPIILDFNSNGFLEFATNSGGWSPIFSNMTKFQAGTWYHLVFVYDGSFRYIYINNSQDNKAAYTSTLTTSTQPFYVGTDGNSTGNPFNGKIDEIKIYNMGLSQTDVTGLYYRGVSSQEANLVGYWKLDDGSGNTVVDSSSVANNGDLTGHAPTWSTDVFIKPRSLSGNRFLVRDFGSCGYFNGTDNHVSRSSLGSILSLTAYTVSMWVKMKIDSANQYCYFFTSGGAGTTGTIALKTSNSNVLRFRVNTTNNAGSSQNFDSAKMYNNNIWHLLTLTNDGTNLNFYVDGILDTGPLTLTQPHNFNTGTGEDIGAGGGVNLMKGNVDEFMFFTRSLTATEVSKLYYTGTFDSTSLFRYLKFDEGSGTSLTDSSGNGITGTWQGTLGSQWSTDVFIKPRSLAGTRSLVT